MVAGLQQKPVPLSYMQSKVMPRGMASVVPRRCQAKLVLGISPFPGLPVVQLGGAARFADFQANRFAFHKILNLVLFPSLD